MPPGLYPEGHNMENHKSGGTPREHAASCPLGIAGRMTNLGMNTPQNGECGLQE